MLMLFHHLFVLAEQYRFCCTILNLPNQTVTLNVTNNGVKICVCRVQSMNLRVSATFPRSHPVHKMTCQVGR